MRLVIDIYASSDAVQVAHRRVDHLEKSVRHDYIRVDEDKNISFCISRSGIACPPDTLRRFANHGRTHSLGDRRGLVPAVVVNDNHFHIDVSPRSQMLGRTLDRLQSGRKISRFIEGGDDDRDVHSRFIFPDQASIAQRRLGNMLR